MAQLFGHRGLAFHPRGGKAGGEGSRRFGSLREFHEHRRATAIRCRGAFQNNTGEIPAHDLPLVNEPGCIRSGLQVNRDEKGLAERSSFAIKRPRSTGYTSMRRGGRVVDRAALEMRSTCKRTGGSNPSLSAINS
jgi:hypothetical protein